MHKCTLHIEPWLGVQAAGWFLGPPFKSSSIAAETPMAIYHGLTADAGLDIWMPRHMLDTKAALVWPACRSLFRSLVPRPAKKF